MRVVRYVFCVCVYIQKMNMTYRYIHSFIIVGSQNDIFTIKRENQKYTRAETIRNTSSQI